MTDLAIFLRLITYPLLALGLFLLATCCRYRRIERLIYYLLSILSMIQLVKSFQQLTMPGHPYSWAEWLMVGVTVALCVCVWLDFFRLMRGDNHDDL